jgi:arylsulfatase A-like enzyme
MRHCRRIAAARAGPRPGASGRARRPVEAARRRTRHAWAILLAVAAAASGLACGSGCDAARPNVVIVVLDTTRADVLSAYGSPRPTTPHVDRVADEGVRFTRAFATDFWTLPSHASLLTGQHPSRVGATSETNRLPDDAVTLAERLRDAGWRTGAFVSNAWVSAERGFAQGFETFVETWRSDAPGERQLDARGIDEARSWLTERAEAGEPFFLLVNLNSAHLPYSPDPLVLVDLSPDPLPPGRVTRLRGVKGMWAHLGGALPLDDTDYAILRRLYEAEVASVDALVGELVGELEARGVLDDTVLVVTSDHGENIGEHGMIDHLLSMYDTTLRVPLILRYPPAFEAGRVDTRLVSGVDIVPTVLELLGLVEDDASVPGRSLVSPDGAGHDHVVAENDRPVNGIRLMEQRYPTFDTTPLDRRVRALRTDRHKIVWYSDGEVELYDLERDPGELHDLSEQEPALRDELLARLRPWMDADDTGKAAPFESRDDDALERLRALGYID